MALSDRKKQRRQKAILMAAADAFKKKGFDGARIDEVADRADVSPGTVYNYFPTKDALLLALVSLYRAEARTERVGFMNNPPDDPCKAFSTLYGMLLDGTLKYLDRTTWRHAQVASIASSWEAGRLDIWDNEFELIKEQEQLLQVLKERGRLPKDYDHAFWARTIHCIGFFWSQQFLADDGVTLSDTKRRMAEQFEIIFGQVGAGNASGKAAPKRAGSRRRK
jgi:AcrR family transcriptional regulator